MDYQKSYPHPRLAGETIVLQWTRGYTSVKVWFRNRELQEIRSPKQLLKGVKFTDEEVGEVTVQLSRNPYFLNVLVDGYHSALNTLHPLKVYPHRRYWFLIPVIIFAGIMIGNSNFFTGAEYQPDGEEIVFWYGSFFLTVSILAYFGVQYRKVWPVILWFSLIALQEILMLGVYLYLLNEALSDDDIYWTILGAEDIIISVVSFSLYSGFLVLIYRLVLKPGWKVWKHQKNQQILDPSLVDTPISNI